MRPDGVDVNPFAVGMFSAVRHAPDADHGSAELRKVARIVRARASDYLDRRPRAAGLDKILQADEFRVVKSADGDRARRAGPVGLRARALLLLDPEVPHPVLPGAGGHGDSAPGLGRDGRPQRGAQRPLRRSEDDDCIGVDCVV